MKRHFNIADLFEMVADRVPGRTALICGEQRASFAELEARANQLAHYLSAQGIGPGDHVGLYLYNCNEYLEGMLACFKIRAVPINVNYRYVEQELLYIFTNSGMVACIHNQAFTAHIAEVQQSVPGLRSLIYVADDSGADPSVIGAVEYEHTLAGQSRAGEFPERADDLFLLYTGGTTGMPKAVMWPHKAIFFAALGGGGWFHPDGAIDAPEQIADRIGDFPIVGMALAPLMHGACWWYACIQLLAGNTVVLNPAHTLCGEEVWDIVAREKVNAISIVGDAMALPLLDALEQNPGRWDLSSVFQVGSGGAVFSPSKQAAFKAHFPNVFITNSFGSSESGSMGLDGSEGNSEGLGNVCKTEFMSVISVAPDRSPRHVKPGETGIFARSGYIPVGYYNDPRKTAETIVEVDGRPWLLLGDEARLEQDNTITVFGRGSNCINTGGEKVFPEEVEQALKAHPGIFDCLVVAVPDERYGSRVAAVIAPRSGASLTLASVQQEARRHIAGYKVPREIHLVDEVPRAPSGKPAYPRALEMALSGDYLAA
jgi:acyl-CoA synthetase (AMP-forming)/AMP-acid ligase II